MRIPTKPTRKEVTVLKRKEAIKKLYKVLDELGEVSQVLKNQLDEEERKPNAGK